MERKSSKSLIILITAITTFILTVVGIYLYFTKTEMGKNILLNKYLESSKQNEDITLKLEMLLKRINQMYIGEIDEGKLLDGALKGYIQGLEDEYSEYLTEKEYQELLIDITRDFVGIGVYIAETIYDEVIILEPIENSPAEEVGLQTGDIIISIDGEECINMTLEEASEKIKGEAGSFVELKIKRGEEVFNKKIQRREVIIKSVDTETLNNIGYINILTFSEGITTEVENALSDFEQKGIDKVIIDVRNNGGGLVIEAITLSEIFLDKNDIIMHTYNKEERDQVIKASKDKKNDNNIIVLVNENSASATEIFAAALKENDVATIVGTKTFGKGVMQSVTQVPFGGALKITKEEFKTPNDNKIDKVGVEPNVVVENDKEGNDKQLEKAIELLKE